MINKKILLLTLSNEDNWNFDKNIFNPLKSIFSYVLRFQDYRKRLYEIGIYELQNEIIDLVRKEKPHYILFPASSHEISKETLQVFNSEGCIIFGWFFDDIIRFNNYSKWFIPYIDYFLTSNKESVHKYAELGAKSIYVPSACNHNIYIKRDVKFSYDVSFVGRNIANREKLINEIESNNIKIQTFGFTYEGIISFEKMINIFSASRINLNFTGSYVNPKVKQFKARIFEITMCGGFLLSEYFNGIEKFYELDKEIVCFNSITEAVEKIKYYLSNDKERQMIADAGYKRAQKNHTWNIRLKKIFDFIEKDINSINYKINTESIDKPNRLEILESNFYYSLYCKWKEQNKPKLSKEAISFSYKRDKRNIKKKVLAFMTFLPSKIYFPITKMIENSISYIKNNTKNNN